MLLSYQECLEKYHTDYGIKKAISEALLHKIEKGIYSEKKYVSELEVIMKKFPNTILTLNSAFYYHSLTDVIPDYYYLSSDKAGSKLKDTRVKQIFEMRQFLKLGLVLTDYQGTMIRIYDKERMLIELIRSKKKIPHDYYKEIIGRYRNTIHTLDIERIQEYASIFPKSSLISETLQMEVF